MSPTLIPALIILGIVLLVVFLFIMVHKKTQNKKAIRQKIVFADFVWKNKLDISESETINNYLFAIDKLNFILLYINFSYVKEVVHVIDLWDVKSVNVVSEYNNVYEYRQGKNVAVDKHIGNLHIEIIFTENNRPKLSLFLYDCREGMQDFVHIQRRATYWSSVINSSVNELPFPLRHNA